MVKALKGNGVGHGDKNAIRVTNKEAQYDKRYELHRLLGALLSKEISVEDKLNIIEKEYDIPVEGSIKNISVMCN